MRALSNSRPKAEMKHSHIQQQHTVLSWLNSMGPAKCENLSYTIKSSLSGSLSALTHTQTLHKAFFFAL